MAKLQCFDCHCVVDKKPAYGFEDISLCLFRDKQEYTLHVIRLCKA